MVWIKKTTCYIALQSARATFSRAEGLPTLRYVKSIKKLIFFVKCDKREHEKLRLENRTLEIL